MADILEFPTRQSQGLAYLERELRQLLLNKGADEALIEFATGQLTSIYQRVSASEQSSFSLSLPEGLNAAQRNQIEGEIDAVLDQLHGQNHKLLLELIAQLLLAELRLFQSRREE